MTQPVGSMQGAAAEASEAQRRLRVYEKLDELGHHHDGDALNHQCLELALLSTGATGGTLLLDGHILATLGVAEADVQTELSLNAPVVVDGAHRGTLRIWGINSPTEVEAAIARMIAGRWASEYVHIAATAASQERTARLEALLDIAGLMSSTLDREQLLEQILTYACHLIKTEAASIFMLDAESGDLILKIASGSTARQVRDLRVPRGRGIAGYVAETGETVVVNDPANDPRFYGVIDQKSKFTTRALICVPLRTRAIQLGEQLGVTEERIVGVAQVLNRVDHQPFTPDDVALFQTLGSQAATVLEVAGLYANMNELFTDVIEAIAAAIDAKDKYTEGHSRRVSQFATEIARELGLGSSFVHRVRISGVLHDVGKIGVPDAVLKKPGPLDDTEFALMKEHPLTSYRIMKPVRFLKAELPGLLEHHERIDGRGYPQGLKGDHISLLGRIIAVADAFDAMTSDRSYRTALSMDEVIRRIKAGAGTQWDAACVAALLRAYDAGRIVP